MSLYKQLELDPDSNPTMEEIRKAYKRMALRYHPDKNNGFESQQFTDLKNAYDILSDPFKRQIYDEERKKPTVTPIVDWKSFMGDVMTSMYVLFSTYVIPKDINLSINVNLSDVYFRRVKKIDVKVKRWTDENRFTTIIQTLYIPLNNFEKVHVFDKMGDDSIIKSKGRSSIKITLNISDFPKGVHIQEMLNDYDLYVIKELNLYEYYTLETIPITICAEQTIDVNNLRQLNYVIKNKGLPFGQNNRGDVFIKIVIVLPEEVPPDALTMLESHFTNI